MEHTLKDWAIALVKSPHDPGLQSGFADWLSENGHHGFDVGDEVYACVDADDPMSAYWIENCRERLYGHIFPGIRKGQIISIGSRKICVSYYDFVREKTVFWPKFLCNNSRQNLEELLGHMNEYIKGPPKRKRRKR